MPLWVIALFVIVGVLSYQLVPYYVGLFSLLLGGVGLCVSVFVRSLRWLPLTEKLGDWGIVLACLSAGVLLAHSESKQKTELPTDTKGKTIWVGYLRSNPKPYYSGRSCYMQTFGYVRDSLFIPYETQLIVRLDSSQTLDLHKHDSLIIRASLREVKSKNDGYMAYLYRNGIHYVAYPKQVLRKNPHPSWEQFWAGLQQRFVRQFRQLVPDSTIAGIASAMFVGDTELLDASVRKDFAATGVSHVLSISGQHVAVIFMLLNLFLLPLEQIRRGKKAKNLLILVLLIFYMLLCGAAPSVVRSVSMFSVILIARLLRKRYYILNLLGLAALIQVLVNPFVLYNLGFQLSFLAVASIVIFYPYFERSFMTDNRRLNLLYSWIGITLCAQIFTFPVILYNFGTFPTYFLLTNLLLAPLAQISIFAGFLLLLTCFIPGINTLLAYITFGCLWLMNKLITVIADFPYAIISKDSLAGVAILLLSLLACFLLLYLPKWLQASKPEGTDVHGLGIWGLE